jgi:ATP-binding cassette subfamily B protein
MDIDAGEDDALSDVREGVDRPMRRLFRAYGRENAGAFAVGVLGSVAARVLDLLPPLLLALAIDAIFVPSGPERRFTLPLVPDDRGRPAVAIGGPDRRQLPPRRGIPLGAELGRTSPRNSGTRASAGFHRVRNWGWNAFAQRIQHAIRTDTYDQMQRLGMGFFADKQTGELMSVLSNDVNRLERFLNDGMNSLFRLSVMVLGIAAILFYTNCQFGQIIYADRNDE